jgi:hypothetical protein
MNIPSKRALAIMICANLCLISINSIAMNERIASIAEKKQPQADKKKTVSRHKIINTAITPEKKDKTPKSGRVSKPNPRQKSTPRTKKAVLKDPVQLDFTESGTHQQQYMQFNITEQPNFGFDTPYQYPTLIQPPLLAQQPTAMQLRQAHLQANYDEAIKQTQSQLHKLIAQHQAPLYQKEHVQRSKQMPSAQMPLAQMPSAKFTEEQSLAHLENAYLTYHQKIGHKTNF